MATSNTGNDAKPLKTDRRVTLDGGLNTRASCLNVQSNQATALGNFRMGQTGALSKRKGGAQLCTINPYAATTSMPAPVLMDAGAATGTLAAGTYTIGYVLGTVSSSTGVIGMSPTTAITVALNHAIDILIPSPNSGEGFGWLTTQTFLDVPENAGYLYSGPNFTIYVKKTGDPNFTANVVAKTGASFFATSTPPQNGQVFRFATYTNTSGVAPVGQLAPIPVRFLFWYPLIDTLIGVSGDTPYALQGALTTPQYMALSNDSAGNPFGFSRLPTRIAQTVVDRCLILSDAVGRPKILDSPASGSQIYGVTLPTSWSFRQLGAKAGAAAPTSSVLTGGVLTGNYKYVYTLVYQRNRQDGSFFLSESNSSPALSVTYAAQHSTITIAAPLESGIVSWNLYRTVAGGTQYFLDATNPIGTLSVSDNAADAALNGQQPPDMGGKVPNDVPPQGLAMVTEFAGQAFGVVSNVLRAALTGGAFFAFTSMTRTRATNIVQYSKVRFVNDLVGLSPTAPVLGTGGIINTLPGDYGNVDAWPSFQTFPCGNSSPITNMVSFRGVLYVFKEDEIGVVEGTPGNYQYRTIWVGSGAMENSIIQIGNYLLAFDQALGPIMVSGYSVQNVGYVGIQSDWLDPVVISAGEAISGGSRGTAGVISKVWDTVNSEARWVISNYQADPTSAIAQNTSASQALLGSQPLFFEYVCQVPQEQPSGQFTRFSGSSNQFGFYGTSSTPNTFVGLPFIFNFVTQSGLSFLPGNVIILINPANPANFAIGIIATYAGTALAVDIISVAGATTINSFNIQLLAAAVVDRRILTQTFATVGTAAIPFRSRDLVYGDYHGRLVLDYQNEFDLNGILTSPISMRATFPFFFGDDPEMVKRFTYLYAMTMMGSNATDVMNIITQSLSQGDGSPKQLVAIAGGIAPIGVNRLQHIPLTGSLDNVNSKDRGAQIVISGSAQSGPTVLMELTVKYQDDNYRSKP